MTDFFKEIYSSQAAEYEQMVSFEDYRANLLPTLARIHPPAEQTIVDLGTGTGRLTCLYAPEAGWVLGTDISAHMLSVAKARVTAGGWENVQLAVADNRHLPVASGSADIAIEGWSLGHSVGWYPDTWKTEIKIALDEMTRVLKPGGTLFVLETLGTGFETPTPPTEGLAELYRWLEDEHGFASTWIRTDYQFNTPAEAAENTRFFFGDELADRILAEGMTILPECTGIWWRHL
jgi:ubiquinone/menaquinone biosynthesis C-methylase UbiE